MCANLIFTNYGSQNAAAMQDRTEWRGTDPARRSSPLGPGRSTAYCRTQQSPAHADSIGNRVNVGGDKTPTPARLGHGIALSATLPV